ncbi:MAG TPA: cytochrome c [Candidatus Limnocylindrales bacterium]|nr:cytochrome c [Candidatus Limnocylindrales bacterium]
MKAMICTMALGMLLAAAIPAAADDSAALYKSKCQVCHGADGKGSAAGQKMGAKDFHSPEVAKQSDADLAKVTKEGKGKMPKYEGKLTDDQIKGLIKYIRSLK